jgi:hypothetical protein
VISANFGLLQSIKVILKDASFEAKRNGHSSDSAMLNLVCSEQISVRERAVQPRRRRYSVCLFDQIVTAVTDFSPVQLVQAKLRVWSQEKERGTETR